MIGQKSKAVWLFLSALLAAGLWVTSQGRVYLKGLPLDVWEGLAQERELVPGGEGLQIYDLLSLLPLDAALAVVLFQSACLIAGFVLLWLALAKVWENPVSPTLTTGLLFFGSSNFWLGADSPDQALAVLFKAVAIACVVAAKVPLLCGAVLALAIADPGVAIALYLTLVYLALRRSRAYGPGVTFLSTVGTAALLAFMALDFVLQPSLSGLSGWSLLPLIGLGLNKELREARLGLYLVLLGSAIISGSPELASAVFLGDAVTLGLRPRPSEEPPAQNSADGISISAPTLVQAVALVLLIAAALPGEQYLNRNILIPSQKAHIPIPQLFVPFSLQTHVRLLESDPWRGSHPVAGMRAEEVRLLKTLDSPFRVLTLDRPTGDRTLSLVYALVCQQKLRGWATPTHLSASSLVCLSLQQNVIVDEEAILFRAESDSDPTLRVPRLESGPTLPPLEEIAPVDLKNLWNLPFRVQTVASEPKSGYSLKTLSSTETLYFPEGPAKVVLSAAPEIYLISGLSNPKEKRELRINRVKLALTAPDLDEVLPSRSLVPLTFKLTNTGETPISTEELKSLTLSVTEGASYQPFQQEFPGTFVLFPQEALEITLYLATPASEGRYQLHATFETIDGVTRPLPIQGETWFRSWRRLSPVGTWVEEPAKP